MDMDTWKIKLKERRLMLGNSSIAIGIPTKHWNKSHSIAIIVVLIWGTCGQYKSIVVGTINDDSM